MLGVEPGDVVQEISFEGGGLMPIYIHDVPH